MDASDILYQMINSDARVTMSKPHGKRNQAELCEPQCADSKVTIYGLPDDAVIIKADAFTSPDSIFQGNKGECKRADYVVISESKKIILYIEIKSRKGTHQEIVKQLQGAQCFVIYCREIGRVFWNSREFLRNFQDRFISIGHTGIPKRPTRITPSVAKHDRPESMLKIDWPHHVEFNRLI